VGKRGKLQHVLVADDRPFFRSGLRTLLALESDLKIVGEASTISEALAIERFTDPDVVVISASLVFRALPGERDRIRGWGDRAAMVLLADAERSEGVALAEELGSPVLLYRGTPTAQIMQAIREAGWKEERDIAEGSRTAADLKALVSASSSRTSILTSREAEVVKLLAEGRTVRETAAELCLSAKTIEAHKLNIMRKLDIHNRQNLIQYAIEQRIITPIPA
jgi:two-component system, NarL family, response regulator NreC